MIRIHVNTSSLQKREPAIIIVDPYGKYTDQYSNVQLCCSKCTNVIGVLDQQGDSAHLVINDISSITHARTD